ncbi:hypothetical protein NMY22_g13870 [Coprinellus aureogranulatus]|nr:hypothetical protein NMY22_g13870 [Coprinellus aureogranulatus]
MSFSSDIPWPLKQSLPLRWSMSCLVRKPEHSETGRIVLRPFSLDIDIWNRSYNFSGIVEHLSTEDHRLLDPTFLVIQAPLALVTLQVREPTIRVQTDGSNETVSPMGILSFDGSMGSSPDVRPLFHHGNGPRMSHNFQAQVLPKRRVTLYQQTMPAGILRTHYGQRSLIKVQATDVDLTLLRNDELPAHVLPVSYNFNEYRRAILDPAGLEDRQQLGIMHTCKSCLGDLSRQLMPRFALANWLYYARERLPAEVHEAFSLMSIFEKSLICRVRTNSILCRFTGIDSENDDGNFTSRRRHIKGNVISTPLDVAKVNNLLPPSSSEIGDTICAVFVSSIPPTAETIAKLHPILVRKSRVKLLIEFLLANNSHYQTSEAFGGYSAERLDSLFTGTSDVGVPTSVRIGHLPVNEAVESVVSDYIGRMDGLEGLFMENVAYTLGDRSAVSYQEMSLRALQRCKEGRPFLASKSGSTPVPDIDNPNWLSWAHPNADPYGIGGFHHPRRKRPIGMEQQLRHLLNVNDPFWENDPELAFSVYNIVRKAAVNTSLRFSVPYTSYTSVVQEIARMDQNRLAELRRRFQQNPNYQPGSEEEARIIRVMTLISPVARNIPGSVAQRIKMRNEIRAIISQRGSPTLFVTLNPADYFNPIVTVLGKRCSTVEEVEAIASLNTSERTSIALKHPVACAQFFDIMIKRFVRIVLRYRRSGSKEGIFGVCDAYYGTVETQGRGSLHCHMLIWLRGHLPPETLASKLRTSEQYRDRLKAWLDSIVESGFVGRRQHLNLPATQQDREELGLPEVHPATVVGPVLETQDIDTFTTAMKDYTDDLLLRFNWHLHSGTCWKYLRPRDPRVPENCRFGMDGTVVPETSIEGDTGSIKLRRRHPRMTHYNPVLTFLMKCNTDVKFIGSGDDAKSFMYYVTDYITKAPLSMYAGLTALSYAIRQGERRGVLNNSTPTADDSRRAMTIAVNSMLGSQEISHPQVMSFVLGGGESYTSEKFSTINWGEVKRYVERGLQESNAQNTIDVNARSQEETLNVSIGVLLDGQLTVSNQLLDYIYRPPEEPFGSMGLYRHLSSTIKITAQSSADTSARRHQRSPTANFISQIHPQFSTHMLKLRKSDLTPVLLGPRIARRQGSAAERERWAQDICTLFKPWRHPTDLKHGDTTWYDHLQALLPTMSETDITIIDNMSLLAEAKHARDERPRRTRREAPEERQPNINIDAIIEEEIHRQTEHSNANIFSLLGGDADDQVGDPPTIPGRLEMLIGPQASDAFRQCVKAYQLSPGPYTTLQINSDSEVRQTNNLAEQATFMARFRGRVQDTHRENEDEDNRSESNPSLLARQPIQTHHPPSAYVSSVLRGVREGSEGNPPRHGTDWDAAMRLLDARGMSDNPEQRRAYSIVAHHVIEGGPQLLLYVGGRGGSGKSYLIESIVDLFQLLGRPDELRLGAFTGIAASLIGGNTLHSLLAMGPNHRKSSLSSKLTSEWKRVQYLIIDETSMVGAQFLSAISSRLKILRGDVTEDHTKVMGGVNIIFTGDFYQLSPPKQPSLFSHKLVRDPTFVQTRNNDGVDAIAGAFIWRQVEYVVLLKQNKRQGGDPVLAELLDRVRSNTCLDREGRPISFHGFSAMDHLRRREISYVVMHAPDTLQLFVDAPVIVGSKTIRDALNACLLNAHATRLGARPEIYYSRDSIHRQKAIGDSAVYLWNLAARYTSDSLGQLPLFVGMKVMVTENVSVAFKVVNGSEGIVEDIRYSTDDAGRRFADAVYVKIERCSIHVPGLNQGVVPIFPTSISIAQPVHMGSIQARSFRRQQIPVVPSYSYTDYKSQGRTLERAIIDITSSRGQGIYVMLSRVKSLDGLLILRWFPDSKIIQRMSGELRDELCRLEALDERTEALYTAGILAPSPLNQPVPHD